VADISQNRKILVVDDDELILNMMRDGLTKNGFEVIIAANGFEGILAVEEEKPDLVITDIMMPKLSGIEFLKALKNNVATRNLQVILISAVDEVDMIQEGLAMGAVDYITKPFKMNEIVGKLRHYLS
jgi:DNA-binding response OmpR family regulator